MAWKINSNYPHFANEEPRGREIKWFVQSHAGYLWSCEESLISWIAHSLTPRQWVTGHDFKVKGAIFEPLLTFPNYGICLPKENADSLTNKLEKTLGSPSAVGKSSFGSPNSAFKAASGFESIRHTLWVVTHQITIVGTHRAARFLNLQMVIGS